jgi:FG-GAP-like repeat
MVAVNIAWPKETQKFHTHHGDLTSRDDFQKKRRSRLVQTIFTACVATVIAGYGPWASATSAQAIDPNVPWVRHTIVAGSDTLRGSDGVHLADINDDGQLDVVSGHEKSHNVSVSLHPGFDQAESPWSTIVLPSSRGPEDAVFADVDGDKYKDVIVGSEGQNMVTVLFAPKKSFDDLQTSDAWERMDLAVGMRAMRVAFANVAGDTRPEIVVGGKEGSMTAATIGYYSLTDPLKPRVATNWAYTSIRPVGWVMQMFVLDAEQDGDRDIVYTDREPINVDVPMPPDNSARGLRWLENSGGTVPTWTDHQISALEADHKWFDIGKWDADNDLDIVDCRSSNAVHENHLWLNNGGWQSWAEVPIAEPDGVGNCQHITFADIDNDDDLDLGITYAQADAVSGVIWLRNVGTTDAPVWEDGEISGSADGDGIKFDNLVWYDIDDDDDLDAVTSEQHEGPDPNVQGPGLGVIWYENPLNQ